MTDRGQAKWRIVAAVLAFALLLSVALLIGQAGSRAHLKDAVAASTAKLGAVLGTAGGEQQTHPGLHRNANVCHARFARFFSRLEYQRLECREKLGLAAKLERLSRTPSRNHGMYSPRSGRPVAPSCWAR